MKKYVLSLILMLVGFIAAVEAQTCVQPAANMISWWRGEGNAQDARNLHHGALQGGAAFASGRVGQAFSLDGTNDAILLGNQSGLQPASLTLEAWINVNSIADGEVQNIFAKWGFDATVDSYLFGVINNGGGQLQAFGAIGDGSTGDPGLAGGSFSTGSWNHLAMTYNAADSVHKLYLNGAEVASRVRPNGLFPTASLAYLGRQDSSLERLFNGLIDEPTIYSRALSGNEIQAIFNSGTAGKCVSLNSLSGNFSQKQKITPNPLVGSTGFGNSVAINGDTMVVGASGYDTTPTTGINIGTAYVFVRSNGTWTQQARLSAADGAAGDEFGYSVAISGDTIVVGSYKSDASASNSGAAYVFTRSGTNWTQQQKLTASDGAGSDEFGVSVAIEGETIAVGAHHADQPSGGGDAGAVYIFNRSGTAWSQSQKLIPTGSVLFGDFLGASVAISGDTLAAGASGDQEPSRTNRGTVYVYTRSGNTFSPQQKLVVPDSQPSTQLGSSVAIDGETLISGALGDTPTTSQPNHGAAYIFTHNSGNWSLQQRLTASDAAMSDFFGWSVAVRGDTAVVGARYDDTTSGEDAGSAYVFTRSGANWSERQKLNAGDATQNDRFGVASALSADGTLVIGASEKNLPNGQGNTAGAAYVFNISKYKVFDFDGDGKTDIGIFRPSDGSWWYSRSSDSEFRVYSFGASSDVIVPGDFTGDGKTDPAVFRPSSGFWFIQRSEDNSFFSFPFGAAGDVPTPRDFDGDGKTDAAVFRPSSGTWFILNSNGSGTSIVNFGSSEDKPVPSDFDGDGKADIAIFRPSDGSWWYLRSSDSQFRVFRFGVGTDKPVPGDYTGDGKADVAIFRPSTGDWYFQRSEDNSYYVLPFGANGDIPTPGDYDGDGKFDTAVFRPSTANWFIQRSSGGFAITTFGANGDRPIPGSFVP